MKFHDIHTIAQDLVNVLEKDIEKREQVLQGVVLLYNRLVDAAASEDNGHGTQEQHSIPDRETPPEVTESNPE